MSGATISGSTTFDALTAVGDDRLGPWQAGIAASIGGFRGTHGGYLAAIALRAMARLVPDPTFAPRSLSVRLLAPVMPGMLDVMPTLERAGSSLAATTTRLEQNGEATGGAAALFGAPRRSVEYAGATMPDVPEPERCKPLIRKPAPEVRAGDPVEHRPAAPPLPLSGGGRAEILVWMRLREDRPLDPLALAMLADAGPPALFAHLTQFIPIPSVEISLQFAAADAAAASPWVLGSFRTVSAGEGYVIETGELWTPAGTLLATTHQLRRITAIKAAVTRDPDGASRDRGSASP